MLGFGEGGWFKRTLRWIAGTKGFIGKGNIIDREATASWRLSEPTLQKWGLIFLRTGEAS